MYQSRVWRAAYLYFISHLWVTFIQFPETDKMKNMNNYEFVHCHFALNKDTPEAVHVFINKSHPMN